MKATEITTTASKRTELAAVERVRRYAQASASEATRDAYRADWATFEAWCQAEGLSPLPASETTVAGFIAARADVGDRASTVERRLSAIAKAHKLGGHPTPTRSDLVKQTMAGIRRTLGTAKRQKGALVTGRLLALLGSTGDDLRGTRDRAVLSLGFVGGLRRSEIAALDVENVAFVEAGALVTIARSKTDQEGAGRSVEIAATRSETCPVRAIRAWIEAAALTEGPLFREIDRSGTRLAAGRMSDRAVARTVQRLAKLAGVSGDFGGHSLRAGFATQAIIGGVARESIMKQGGWKSENVMRSYYREATAFRLNYSAALRL
jgi:site-specific recombinase XerD